MDQFCCLESAPVTTMNTASLPDHAMAFNWRSPNAGILRRALRDRPPILQTVLFATDYEILHGIAADPARPCCVQPREKPHRIAILINEARFRNEPALLHSETVWMEERGHDWEFSNGHLFYYGHALRPGQLTNLLAVYQEVSRQRPSPPA